MSTRLALVAALFALALPGSAAAAPAISNVSSPGDHSRLLYDRQAASTVHLAGTANFPVADVYCLSLESDGSKRFDVVLANVPVTSGTFDVPQASLALVAGRLCRWIALPSGVVPGTLNDASLAQVTGPVVATSTIDRRRSLLSGGPNDGQPYKWYALAQGFNGGFDFVSPGNGGLYDDFLQDPATLRRANPMFFGNSGLYYDDVPDGSDHSELVADEIDAYDRYGAVQLYNPGGAVGSRSEDAVHLPADELESLTIDPATGDVTVRARSDIAVCTGSTDAAIPHPTPGQSNTTTCPDFASAGLRLEQVYTQSHEGNLTLQQLRFVSTDGKPHHLDWWPAQAIQVDDAPSYQPSFLMAWLSGDFQTFGSGAAPAAPTASPASIDVKGNSTAADGDPAFAVGTMIFSQAPSGLRFDDENNIYDAGYFETHLVRDVPAGGAAQFTFAYADGFTRAAVQPLAAEALATLTFGLTLDGPADGSTTKLSPATVTGHRKEGGNGMPATVKVNGADTPVDANGAFSANVAL